MKAQLEWIGLGVAALALAGCSSGGSAAPGTQTAGEAGSIKVVFIPKNTGNPYFDQVEAGMKQEADKNHVDVDSEGPATGDATSQLPTIKAAAEAGAKSIVISANSPDALNEELDRAHAKGVAIITVDSDLTGNETHRDVGVLQTDFARVGPSQLELIAKEMNYTGDFAILSATADAPNQNAWIASLKEAMKSPKYEKMKLVDVVYGDDEAQKSSTEMEALMSKYPNLKGVLSPTSVGLAAAAQVLENSGDYPGGPNARNGGLFLTGLSTPKQMQKAVAKGVVAEFQLWDPALMGEIADAFAHEIVLNHLQVKPGITIDVPDVGKVKVLNKNVVYAGPILTFDKNNISKYNF